MSENALAIREPLSPSTWQMITAIAPAMHECRFYGVSNAQQAMAIMLKGHEVGFALAASFEFIQVIQNKPTLSPRGALALIHQSGQLAGMKIEDKEHACTVWMKRSNGFEYSLTYSLDDAKRAGLVTQAGTLGKDGTPREAGNYEKYESNMLRWRCVGFVADVVFPDILGGMKRADEFGAAVDASGNVIETQWTVQEVPASPTTTQPAQPTPVAKILTLDDLVTQYGADAVMSAAGGRIPGTMEEVETVAAMLAGA